MRLGPLLLLATMSASCGKPTCPADDLECLFASFKIADYKTAPDGPWEALYRVDRARLAARSGSADAGVTLALIESELAFDDAEDSAALGATMTDAAGCRPSLCFSACQSKLSCFAYSRCTPARRDGLVTQTTAHWVEYEKAPSTSTEFELQVIAASAPGCPADVTALINDPTQTLFVSEPAWVKFKIPGKGAPPVGGTGGGSGTGGGPGGGGGTSSATITSDVSTVSLATTACNSTCTVSKTVVITSSTAWTSSPPGFGSLGSGFTVTPDVGPAGTTSVVISYAADCCPSPANGFIRFRTSQLGVYVEVNVVVTVN